MGGVVLIAGGILVSAVGVVITAAGAADIAAAAGEEAVSGGFGTLVVLVQVQGGMELVTVYGPGTIGLGGGIAVGGVVLTATAFC